MGAACTTCESGDGLAPGASAVAPELGVEERGIDVRWVEQNATAAPLEQQGHRRELLFYGLVDLVAEQGGQLSQREVDQGKPVTWTCSRATHGFDGERVIARIVSAWVGSIWHRYIARIPHAEPSMGKLCDSLDEVMVGSPREKWQAADGAAAGPEGALPVAQSAIFIGNAKACPQRAG